jgi:hypothetical protein
MEMDSEPRQNDKLRSQFRQALRRFDQKTKSLDVVSWLRSRAEDLLTACGKLEFDDGNVEITGDRQTKNFQNMMPSATIIRAFSPLLNGGRGRTVARPGKEKHGP